MKIEGEGKLRNTSVHAAPDGEVAAVYRKLGVRNRTQATQLAISLFT